MGGCHNFGWKKSALHLKKFSLLDEKEKLLHLSPNFQVLVAAELQCFCVATVKKFFFSFGLIDTTMNTL